MYASIFSHPTATYRAVLAINRRIAEAAPRYRPTGPSGHAANAATVHIATLLNPRERWAVDVSGEPRLRFTHRDTLGAIGADLTSGAADAVLVSTTVAGPEIVPQLGSLMRAFPAHLFAGLVSGASEAEALTGTLRLGRAGVRSVVDVRRPDGWPTLRRLFNPAHVADAFMRSAVTSILSEIASPTEQADSTPPDNARGTHSPANATPCATFFRLVFSPSNRNAKGLAARLGVPSSTLVSRFYRAGLPSPKRYLAYARLVWAAHLGEYPGLSISAIADRLSASSPQSFSRAIHLLMGMRPGEFRLAFDGPRMLDHFRATLVTPYRDTLRTFDPVGTSVTRRLCATRTSTLGPKPTGPRGHSAAIARAA